MSDLSAPVRVDWVVLAACWALRRVDVDDRDLRLALGCTSEQATALLCRLESWQIITRESGGVRYVVRIARKYQAAVERVLKKHSGFVPGANPLVRLLLPPATVRQRQVLELIAEGESLEQIGKRLYITRETVKTHVQNLYILLGARGNSANLVHQAYRHGLLPPPHLPAHSLPAPSGKDSR